MCESQLLQKFPLKLQSPESVDLKKENADVINVKMTDNLNPQTMNTETMKIVKEKTSKNHKSVWNSFLLSRILQSLPLLL